MIEQVVVGIDGSEAAFDAFTYAKHFASSLSCELKAVFVLDSRKTELPIIYATGHFDYAFARTYVPPDPELKGFYAKIRKDLEEFGRNLLDVCREDCGRGGIPFVSVLREGLPSTILAEESRSGDILFVGQKGENARFDRTIVGSTTEDVVRSSPRPVMICPSGFRRPEKLLFPYDGSITAERALQFCINAFGDYWKELVLLFSEEQESYLERELHYLNKHGVSFRVVAERGSPVDTVLQVARREGSDLILVGSHGRNKIKDYLLGSTTVHLVRESEIPVLVVY
ncbi:MAG: universal stress protein [Spirochaetales bacterium]|nr:universal stress protein [Spirochaetales bacterium]